jgi:hypothetical protein
MTIKPFAIVLTSLLVLGLTATGCTGSSFSGTNKSPKKAEKTNANGLSDGNDDGGSDSGLSVPVGQQKNLPNLESDQIESCQSDDTSIATVDATTCKVTGVTVGTTSVKVTMADGTTQNVPVTVTSPGASDGNSDIITDSTTNQSTGGGSDSGVVSDDGSHSGENAVISDDGEVTSIRGKVCLGGPACNISFLTRTEADAQACMQAANSAPCSNDPGCGTSAKLNVCNCQCDSGAGLQFTEPSTCFRYNPQINPNGAPRVAVCHKI